MEYLDRMVEELRAKRAAERVEIEGLLALDSAKFADEDGYPTEAALRIIELWPSDWPASGVFNFIKPLWAMPHFGWHSSVNHEGNLEYHLSTAGWSGNESIIKALKANVNYIWEEVWVQSRRGGHFTFEIEESNDECDA
jgi:hypothetical protein